MLTPNSAPAIADTPSSSVLPPASSGTFDTYGATTTGSSSAGAGAYNLAMLPAGSLTISYSPDGTYTVTQGAASQSMSPSQVNAMDAAVTTYATTPNYLPQTGSRYATLTLLNNSTTNSSIVQAYSSYGFGYTSTHSSQGDDYKLQAFVFGSATPSSALPRPGAAYYKGPVDGYAVGFAALPTRLTGNGDILINFYTSEVATALDLASSAVSIGHVDGRGALTNSTAAVVGDLFGSGIPFTGRFNGSLYGPNAEEAGYSFTLQGDGKTLVGVLVGASTTVPGPGPSAPAIIPPTGLNTRLDAPLVSETFSTKASRELLSHRTIFGSIEPNNTVSVAQQYGPGEVIIAYDATTHSYSVSDPQRNVSFASATQFPRSSTTDYIVLTSTNRLFGEQLTVFNNSPTNPRLGLTYLSYGLWSDYSTSGFPAKAQSVATSFIFGVATSPDELPRGGAALYDGTVDGFWSKGGINYSLGEGSNGSILANFYTGEIRTTMLLVGRNGDQTATLGRVEGVGSILSGTTNFSGTASGTGNAYSGTFTGGLYGPVHVEAGASFALRGPAVNDSVSAVLVSREVPIH